MILRLYNCWLFFQTHPSQTLREMYTVGQRCFGENYLQEALTKIDELQDLDIEWHFYWSCTTQ